MNHQPIALTMTYELAMACARDAANRSMHAAGRSSWGPEDYTVAVRWMDKLYPAWQQLRDRLKTEAA